MSCYQVNKETIDLIVSAFIWANRSAHTKSKPETDLLMSIAHIIPNEGGAIVESARSDQEKIVLAVGRELIQANIESVVNRYNTKVDVGYSANDYFGNYIQESEATIEQVLGAISCYEYQSCESVGWETSWSKQFMDSLRKNLCSMIAGDNWEYKREELSVS